jgi:hypothetical protein
MSLIKKRWLSTCKETFIQSEPSELSPWECCQIAAGWHSLGDDAIDIGNFGDKLNQVVQSDDKVEQVGRNLASLRASQDAQGHWVAVEAIDKAIALCRR